MCTVKRCLCAVAFIWAFCCTFATPYMHAYDVDTIVRNHTDVSNGSTRTLRTLQFCKRVNKTVVTDWFKLAEMLLFYATPLVLFLLLYARLACVLWSTPAVLRTQLHFEQTTLRRRHELDCARRRTMIPDEQHSLQPMNQSTDASTSTVNVNANANAKFRRFQSADPVVIIAGDRVARKSNLIAQLHGMR